ncbi:MAG: hypothetical protein DMF77_24075 [Acidobacteria bacterium]|nr:MAG: hypothetical protein DMF77_24075 [Acidobacteriota bacterium]
MGEEAGLLDHVADRAAQDDGIPALHVASEHSHLSAVGPHQPIDRLERRGLARAAGAEEDEHLALEDGKRDPIEGSHRARELLGHLDQRRRRD